MRYIDTQHLALTDAARTLTVRLAHLIDAAGTRYVWMIDSALCARPYAPGHLREYTSEKRARRGMDAYIDRNARTLRRA